MRILWILLCLTTASAAVAESAPDFAAVTASGEAITLSDEVERQRTILFFWASWCPPCREEAPILEQTWRKYRDQGVVFLGLDIWDTEEDARAYMREFDITFPNAVDNRGRIAVMPVEVQRQRRDDGDGHSEFQATRTSTAISTEATRQYRT